MKLFQHLNKNIYVPSGSEESYKSKAANLKDKIKVLDLVD